MTKPLAMIDYPQYGEEWVKTQQALGVNNVLMVGPECTYKTIAAALTAAAAGGATLGTAAVAEVKAYSLVTLPYSFPDLGVLALTVDGVEHVYNAPEGGGTAALLAEAINADIGNGEEGTGEVLAVETTSDEVITITCVSAVTITSSLVCESGVPSVDTAGTPAEDAVPAQSAVIVVAPGVTPPTAAQMATAQAGNIRIVGLEELGLVKTCSQSIIVGTEWHLNLCGWVGIDASAGHMTRRKITISHDCRDLALLFGNVNKLSGGAGGAMSTSTTFTIHAVAIEDADGAIHPVTFSGERGVTITGDGTPAGSNIIESDPLVGVEFAAGDVIYVHSAMKNEAGAVCPGFYTVNYPTDLLIDDQWAEGPVTVVDTPYAAEVGNIWNDSGAWVSGTYSSIGPTAIFGTVTEENVRPNVLLIGDSILAGNDPFPSLVTSYLAAHNIPYMVSARPSEAPSSAYTYNKRIAALAERADIILCQLGVNNGNESLANFQGYMRAFWAKFPGKPIYQFTITPFAGRDDEAATLALAAKNDWIRTCPAPLAGVIDFADLCMTARNSNVWRPLYSAEGIHPYLGYPQLNAEIAADPMRWVPMLYDGSRLAKDRVIAPVVSGTVTLATATDGTYAYSAVPIVLPHGLLRSVMVETAALGGTGLLSGKTATFDYAVGTAATVDNDLADENEATVVAAHGPEVVLYASRNITPTYKISDALNTYIPAAGTTLYLNVIGKIDDVTGTDKTLTIAVKVWAIVDPLP